MTDYTPTTEEVRTGYSTATYDDSKAEAEFDRWLAEVKSQERERILSIIRRQENWNGHYFNAGETTEDCACRDCEPVLQLIALIEGKNIG